MTSSTNFKVRTVVRSACTVVRTARIRFQFEGFVNYDYDANPGRLQAFDDAASRQPAGIPWRRDEP